MHYTYALIAVVSALTDRHNHTTAHSIITLAVRKRRAKTEE